jgi:hypothetical protein
LEAQAQNGRSLLAVAVFAWDIVLRCFLGRNLGFIRIGRFFYTFDYTGLVRLSFFNQFLNTFGIGISEAWKTLNVTRLSRGIRSCPFGPDWEDGRFCRSAPGGCFPPCSPLAACGLPRTGRSSGLA